MSRSLYLMVRRFAGIDNHCSAKTDNCHFAVVGSCCFASVDNHQFVELDSRCSAKRGNQHFVELGSCYSGMGSHHFAGIDKERSALRHSDSSRKTNDENAGSYWRLVLQSHCGCLGMDIVAIAAQHVSEQHRSYTPNQH